MVASQAWYFTVGYNKPIYRGTRYMELSALLGRCIQNHVGKHSLSTSMVLAQGKLKFGSTTTVFVDCC